MEFDRAFKKLNSKNIDFSILDDTLSYHGKAFTVDDYITAIGAYNFDMRSTYISTELMMVVNSKEFNREFKKLVKEYDNIAYNYEDDKWINSQGEIMLDTPFIKKVFLKGLKIITLPFRHLM